MDKHNKIYVAGHDGLVGSAIVRGLRRSGYSNLVFRHWRETDLRNQSAADELFKKETPEYVILAAAKVGGIAANSTYRAEFIYDNIMIASNVVSAAYKHGVKKLLNLGSSCIYPKYADQPLKEEYLLTGELEPTNEPYAIAKIAAIKLCRYFNEQYGTNFISVMPCNMYGPGDNFNLETSHVLPALMRKLHLAKLLMNDDFATIKKDIRRFPIAADVKVEEITDDKRQIEDILNRYGIFESKVVLWGSGEPFREFLYVDDFADSCVYLMERYDYKDIGEFINIGSGKDQRIKRLASIVAEVVSYKGDILYDSSMPDGTPRKLLDVSRIQTLGWKSTTELPEGISKSYSWYVEQIH